MICWSSNFGQKKIYSGSLNKVGLPRQLQMFALRSLDKWAEEQSRAAFLRPNTTLDEFASSRKFSRQKKFIKCAESSAQTKFCLLWKSEQIRKNKKSLAPSDLVCKAENTKGKDCQMLGGDEGFCRVDILQLAGSFWTGLLKSLIRILPTQNDDGSLGRQPRVWENCCFKSPGKTQGCNQQLLRLRRK